MKAVCWPIGRTGLSVPSAAHNFLDIKIVQSDGGIVKKDVYGAYVDEE